MPDLKYCYENTDVLRNKLNIRDAKQLFEAEVKLTSVRLQERNEEGFLSILTSDDLNVTIEESGYDYYDNLNNEQYALYNAIFEAKIKKMRSYYDKG